MTTTKYRLVPCEPTEAMLDADWVQSGESSEMRPRTHTRARRRHTAMLAAAPKASEDEALVERVAQALYEVQRDHDEEWGWTDQARAVLKMLEGE